eukprot:CAMPEP_0168623206 /NCGR_PEP_ID=MMETSP0449_2-20121227/8697_1 /TAXON_ID=1082188 /ORGANISM="Strombidium rassoulzadegani, Strain ras09" /LENGTH=91 /DNA_ID=CAMNT_0008664563 /DNA_START=33 /DNA_END=305 /DNA_ORIENTATION=-
MTPDAEKPDQYGRVCDTLAPQNREGCAAQVGRKAPDAEQPDQYGRVCDALAPQNSQGCAAQVKRVCDSTQPQEGCKSSLKPGVTTRETPEL